MVDQTFRPEMVECPLDTNEYLALCLGKSEHLTTTIAFEVRAPNARRAVLGGNTDSEKS